MALCLLAVAAAVGGVRLLQSRWYQEYRLRRMSETELRAWTERQPADALGHYYLALARDRAGDAAAAAEQYARALDLDPLLTPARPQLATLLLAQGERRAAESLLQQGVQLDPASAALHVALGQLYEAREDFRRAAYEWELATSLAPGEAEAWFRLGNCWMSLNDESRALWPYRRAVERAPLSATYQKALAGALRLRGEYAEAERHCRRALQLRPDDPEAHFQLMKILRDRDGATPEAEASMRRAVSLQPDNAQFRYYMGAIYQERGQLEPAAAEYQAALRLLRAREPRATSSAWADWGLWLSYLEGAHFNLAKIDQRLGRAQIAAGHLAEFQRVSDYHIRANQLIARIGNRPDDTALRFQLARLHTAAGFPQLAEEQYHAGLRLRRHGG